MIQSSDDRFTFAASEGACSESRGCNVFIYDRITIRQAVMKHNPDLAGIAFSLLPLA